MPLSDSEHAINGSATADIDRSMNKSIDHRPVSVCVRAREGAGQARHAVEEMHIASTGGRIRCRPAFGTFVRETMVRMHVAMLPGAHPCRNRYIRGPMRVCTSRFRQHR